MIRFGIRTQEIESGKIELKLNQFKFMHCNGVVNLCIFYSSFTYRIKDVLFYKSYLW